MALWLVRAGSNGEREQDALRHNLAIVGWSRLEDLSSIKNKADLRALIEAQYPDSSKNRMSNFTGQIWAFVDRIKPNDLVALPLKSQPAIAIGKVTGPYTYRTDLSAEIRHTRPVQWIKTDIPRTAFDQNLLYSLGAMMTVCQITRDNAEDKVRVILSGRQVPQPPERVETGLDDGELEPDLPLDLEQAASDQIRQAIDRHFKGHELARLVDAILQAEGYVTERSLPGPDGGVDILAGKGPFGFDSPKICVQVKSGNQPLDVGALRELNGVAPKFRADQGLLVSWGGFKQALLKESKDSFFKVRLWTSDNLIESILRNYDRLPDEIKAELPLKRIWTLVSEEE
jgi:restriction system protein